MFTALVADADADGPLPWLATAYVPGPSLAQAVAEHGPLPPGAVLALTAGLAEGLTAIHAVGVVHRDLKPSNVLLAADGPRVIDFGISRAAENSALTGTGLVIGSPGFMSPEQAEGGVIGPPSDVFSLGAVLTFAATGQGPFGSGSTAALVYRVVHGSPSLEQVPDDIRPLVQRCLDKDPARRPTPADLLLETSTSKPAVGWLPEPVVSVIAQDELPGRPGEVRTATAMNIAAPVPAMARPELHQGAMAPQQPPHDAMARTNGAAGRHPLRSRRFLAVAFLAACLVAAAATAFTLSSRPTVPSKPRAAAAPAVSPAARASSLPRHSSSSSAAAPSTSATSATSPAAQVSAPPSKSPATRAPATPPASSPANPTSPAPASNEASCAFGGLCMMATGGTLTGGAIPEQYANDPDIHVAGLNTPPATVTIAIGGIPAAGAYTLSIWYENNSASDGLTEPRDMTLLVNGHVARVLNFAVTSSWYESTSKVTTATVQVPAGVSTFAVACQAGDSCHINLWKIELAR
jgi:serine/threonine protein kinase